MSFAPYLERGKAGLRRVNSYLTIGTFIAAVVGPALGAVATGQFSVYSVFILMGVVTAIGAVVSLKVHEKYSPEDEKGEEKDPAHKESTHSQVLEAEAEKLAVERGINLTEPVRPTQTSVTAGTSLAGRNVPKRRVKKENPFAEALEGWNIIKKSRNLRYYLMVAIAMIFGFGAFDALEPIYFKQILEVDISALGWINAIGGVGLIIGVVLLAVFPLKWINSRLLVFLLLVCGIGSVVYVATFSLWWVAAGQLILGFVFGIFDPLMRTLVQADSPLEAVGRVLGTINMISLGLLLIPLVVAPWLSDLLGVQQVLIIMGALPIVFGVLLFPNAKRLDKDVGDTRQIEGVSALD
jgi:MFS family permease